jgi:hypothetical protein
LRGGESAIFAIYGPVTFTEGELNMTRIVASVLGVLALLCVPAAAAVIVSVPTNADSGAPGGTVSVPVNVSDGSGVYSADLVLAYDKDVLSVVNVGVGSLNPAFLYEYSVNAPGVLTMSTYSTSTELTADPGFGSILNVTFSVLPGTAPGATTLTVLPRWWTPVEYGLNEGGIGASYSPGSVNVVPEPSTWAMLVGLLAAGSWTAFRRRKEA